MNQSPNCSRNTDHINWLENFNMAWPHNGKTVLAQILTGRIGEPSFFFYEFCGIHSQNWIITAHAHSLTSSFSLIEANSYIGGARSLS